MYTILKANTTDPKATIKWDAISEPIEGRLPLLDVFARICSATTGRLDFSRLNVTGKDTVRTTKVIGTAWSTTAKMVQNVYIYVDELKPYKVVDEFGHSQDIKSWTEEIAIWTELREKIGRDYWLYNQSVLPGAEKRDLWVGLTASKCLRRQRKAPALLKQNRREMEVLVRDEELEGMPMRHPNRQRLDYSLSGYTDKEESYRKGSRSWKAQSRSPKQWAKHKKGVKAAGLRKTDKRDFPLPECEEGYSTLWWDRTFEDEEAVRLAYSERLMGDDAAFEYLVG